MRFIIVTVAGLLAGAALLFSCLPQPEGPVQDAQAPDDPDSFYSLGTRTLAGDPAELSTYRGRVALVVNVASKCGLTPQYEGLEALHEELAPRGFTVLGFPSNDFKGQEPGSPEEIRTFCTERYGVTFPLFEKRSVQGDEKDEVYRFLTRELEEPTWNFTKYLVDRDGVVLARFDPRTPPDDPGLREAIEQALVAPAAGGDGAR